MYKKQFIVFEGLDGSGKSTQLKLLANRLRKNLCKVYETREPTEGPIGSIIRQIMSGRLKADERVIATLFAADRLDHLLNEKDGIIKKKENGNIVISDRYYFSSYAYHTENICLNWVINLNSLSTKLLKPDIVFFLDVKPEVCMERIKNSGRNLERYEELKRLRQIRDRYISVFQKLKNDECIIPIDADQAVDRIANDIFSLVQKNLFV